MGEKWKLPPRIKVLEALGAIGDGRVKVYSRIAGKVVSSKGDREYRIIYDPDRNAIFSNDNGSVYRGYLGYPAIAFLMLIGELPYNEKYARALKGIPWREWNEELKHYSDVEERVVKVAEERGVFKGDLLGFADLVLHAIQQRGYEKLDPSQKTIFDFT